MRYRTAIISLAVVIAASSPAPTGRAGPHGDSVMHLPLVAVNRQNPCTPALPRTTTPTAQARAVSIRRPAI